MLSLRSRARSKNRALVFICSVSACLVHSWLPASIEANPQNNRRYEISVITLGLGSDWLTMFGHTALMVDDRTLNIQKVYNFGEFNYGQPNLAQKFLSGRLEFWVEVGSFPFLKKRIEKSERSMTIQKLALTSEETFKVMSLLDEAARSLNRTYHYHHYTANCCTKIRDLLNRALGGLISKSHQASEKTFRFWTRQSLKDVPFLKIFLDLILNKEIDKPATAFDSMYLPFNFASELNKIKLSNGTALVSNTQAVFPDRRKSNTSIMSWIIAGTGAALFLFLAAAPTLIRNKNLARNLVAAGLCFFGLITGFAGVLLVFLWIFTHHSDLLANENLFVFPPTHLIFLFFGIVILTKQFISDQVTVFLRIYILISIGTLVIYSMLKALGLFGQNNIFFSAAAIGFLLTALFSLRTPNKCKKTVLRIEKNRD